MQSDGGPYNSQRFGGTEMPYLRPGLASHDLEPEPLLPQGLVGHHLSVRNVNSVSLRSPQRGFVSASVRVSPSCQGRLRGREQARSVGLWKTRSGWRRGGSLLPARDILTVSEMRVFLRILKGGGKLANKGKKERGGGYKLFLAVRD